MNTVRLSAGLVMGLALMAIVGSTGAMAASEQATNSWLATGTVSKIDGTTFYFLGKDNIVYTIDASRAQLMSDFSTECRSVRVGDSVRVYGTITAPKCVRAARVRVLTPPGESTSSCEPPKKEIKIIYEQPQAPPDTATGAGPAGPDIGERGEQGCAWNGRGLITDIDYTGRQIKLRTSNGQFTISYDGAAIMQGTRRIAPGRLNLGDAVRIVGCQLDTYMVNAREVRLLRTHTEAENALPQLPAAISGVIEQVDYPSLTFKMWTSSTPVVVMADQDTIIQHQQIRMKFIDLKPGMRIKMNGNGSIGTGFAAREILIIGVAP